MGMSSSQARLLTLTSRMHDIEYKAARLEAQKLQMANESRRAYEDYLLALDAKKLQYKTINSDGSISFRDLTCDILQNGCIAGYTGETVNNPLFLQKQDGAILVTPAVAGKFSFTGVKETRTMDKYLEDCGFTRTLPIYDGTEDDTSKIEGYTKIYNNVTNPTVSGSWTPVANTPVTPTPHNYTSFLQATSAPSINKGDITSNTTSSWDISESAVYGISSAQGLDILAALIDTYGEDLKATFVLTSNINMSGKTYECPNNGYFNGTLNGNGHYIENLSSENGLLTFLDSDGKVQNLGLKNVNISSSNDDFTGAIASYSLGTIDNCWVTGVIKGNDAVGGIAAYNLGTISYCNVDAAVSGRAYVGGIVGGSDGLVTNCYVAGSVSGEDRVGGIMGGIGSTGAEATVSDCYLYNTVSGDSDVGKVNGGDSLGTNIHFNNVYYDPKKNTSLPVVGDNPSYTTGTGPIKQEIQTPSISSITTYKGEFFNNIYAALYKSGMTYDEIDQSKIKKYIAKIVNSGLGAVDTSSIDMANINENICKYLNSNIDNGFISDLKNDIQNEEYLSTKNSSYHTTYSSITHNATVKTNSVTDPDNIWKPKDGSVNIPSVDNIKKMLYYALRTLHNDMSITESQVGSWINTNFPTTSGAWTSISESEKTARLNLANINDVLSSYNTTELEKIYSAISGGGSYTNTTNYNTTQYSINFKSSQTVNPVYGKKPKEVGKTWDKSDPDILSAMGMYIMAVRGAVEVIKDGMESSIEYLANILESGIAVLSTFDPEKVAQISNLDPDVAANMPEEEFYKMLGIENTSVAVETSIQEVPDEKNLKKAEAKYEADMKRIDMKDRKYDTELAALDGERNAVKQEMETLKTVAKDNVDRTFKLFG